jgi:hypothetical protein
MKSIIAKKLGLDHEPVAILWSNTKPGGALQIKPHGQTCIMPFFVQIAKNRVVGGPVWKGLAENQMR